MDDVELEVSRELERRLAVIDDEQRRDPHPPFPRSDVLVLVVIVVVSVVVGLIAGLG